MRRWTATGGLVLRNRVRMGTRRLRLNISQVLQLTVAATFAYGFCVYVLGHSARSSRRSRRSWGSVR